MGGGEELMGSRDQFYNRGERYFLKGDWQGEEGWVEVTMEQFVKAERTAGFHNRLGRPDLPATAGFSGGGVQGKVDYPRASELTPTD